MPKIVVLNENTLGYLFNIDEFLWLGILDGSVIRGGHSWLNGPVAVIQPIDKIRPATQKDFKEYRVSPGEYF
jgi:hypothetical protein